jgi:uncharacterized protein (DUF4415 family)
VSKKSIKSDLERVDRLTDETLDYTDIPPLDEAFLANAMRVPWPPTKRQLTIRLDADVLAWLKSLGKGYQTRINRILRLAMESHRPSPRRATARGGSVRALDAPPRPKKRRAV